MPCEPTRRALVLRPERLARILDEHEVVPLAELPQLVELARIAEDVDRDDRPRAVRDRSLDRGRVEIQRALVDVREHGRRAFVDEAVGGSDERVRRRDHLVALPHAGDPAQQMEPCRPRGDGGRVRRADLLGEELLEAVDRRPEREPPGAEHLEDELFVPLVQEREREGYGVGRCLHASAGVLLPTSTRSSQCPQRSLLPRTVSR